MSPVEIGIVGTLALFALLALRVPVAVAMLMVGTAGIWALSNLQAAYFTLSGEAFEFATTFDLIVIPLFVLMGNYAAASGMSRDLYAAAYAWVGRLRGGLALATIAGCAGFAALSGSSVASAITMGRVALPEMRRYAYSNRLATGAVAAGGTLGILIPPSTGFIIYALLTEQSIGKLFIAGVVPGLLLTALFALTIFVQTALRPSDGPAGPATPLREKGLALWRAVPIVGIVAATIGGIYAGWYSPVEASGIGAALALLIMIVRRGVRRAEHLPVLLATVRTTAMSSLIIIGAFVFSPFIARTHIADELGAALVAAELGPLGILVLVLAAYVVLGTFLEGFAMLVLTLPVVIPILEAAQIAPFLGLAPASDDLLIWYGVVMVIVLEMGLISPPVGVNVFVVRGVAEDVPLGTIFRGILPFWLAMIVCLALLVAFPELALWLPQTMIDTGLE